MNVDQLQELFKGYFDVTRVFEYTEFPTLVLHDGNRRLAYVYLSDRCISLINACTREEEKILKTLALFIGYKCF